MLRRLPTSFAIVGLFSLALTACDARYPPIHEAKPVAKPQHQPRPLPKPAFDAATAEDGSLLASHAARKATPENKRAEWSLPTNAKTLIVELMIAAAHDDVDEFRRNLTRNARFGMPDRGELRARPIFSKADPLGLEALTDFRDVTSRLKKKAAFNCRPLQPGWELLAASGAEPMWCTYTSDDGFDMLVFRLTVEDNDPRIDYLGYVRERPQGYIRVANIGDRPPTTPFMKTAALLELPELMPDASNPVIAPRPMPPAPPPPAAEGAPAPEGAAVEPKPEEPKPEEAKKPDEKKPDEAKKPDEKKPEEAKKPDEAKTPG